MIVGSAEVQLRSSSGLLASDFRSDLQSTGRIFEAEGRQIGDDFSDAFRRGVDFRRLDLDGLHADEEARRAGGDAGDEFANEFEDNASPEAGGGFLDSMKSLGGKAGGALTAGFAALGVGASIGALVVSGITGAMDVDKANDKLAAQLGLNEPRAAELGKIAGTVYAGAYGDSLETVNDAIRGVENNIGRVGGSALEGLTKKTLDLASAFDVDLNDATGAAGQLIKTGLAANADEAFDIIVSGFQHGIDKSGDFLDTITEYGTQFRKLGVSGAEATGLLAQGLTAGARDADIVADAIKEFSIRAIDGSTLTSGAFKDLGISAKTMSEDIGSGGPKANAALDETLDRLRAVKDPVDRARIATSLFGTQAEDLGQALFALDPSEAAKGLGEVDGAAARMGKTLNDNASGNIESFNRQVKTTFVDVIGGAALPAVEKAASFLATGFAPAFDAVRSAAASAGEGGGPFAPLVAGASEFVDSILPRLAPAGEALKEFAGNLLGPLQEVGQEILAVVGPALGDIGHIIGEQLIPAFVAVLPVIEPVAAFLIHVIGDTVVLALKGAINVIEGVLKIITGIFEVFTGIFTGNWSKVWDGIKDILSGALGVIVGEIQLWFSVGLLKLFKTGMAALRTLWDDGLALLVKVGKGAIDGLETVVVSGLKGVLGIFTRLPGQILSGLGDLGRLLISGGGDLIAGLRSGVDDFLPKVLNLIKGIPGKVAGFFANAGTLLLSAGRSIVQGLLDGIGELLPSIGGFMADKVPNVIKGPFKKALGIESPSKVFIAFGGDIVKGLIKGIDDDTKTAEKAVERMAEKVADRYAAAADALQAKQDERRTFARSVRDDAISGADIFGGDKVSFGSVSDAIRSQIVDITDFTKSLARLQKEGLNDTTYQQIIGLGVDRGGQVAKALAQSGFAGIGELNSLQSLLTKKAGVLGKDVAGDLYDSGVQAAKGLLAGIASQRSALIDVAEDMGKTIAKSVKEALKIKSPSQLLAEIGEEIPAGLALGIDRRTPAVSEAAGRMAQATLITPDLSQLDALAQAQSRATLGTALANGRPAAAGRTNIYNIDATRMTPAELAAEIVDADRLDAVLHPGGL